MSRKRDQGDLLAEIAAEIELFMPRANGVRIETTPHAVICKVPRSIADWVKKCISSRMPDSAHYIRVIVL